MLKRMAAIATIALLVLVALAACGREEPEPPKGQVTKIPNVPGAPPQVYGKTPAPSTAAAGQATQAPSGGGAAQGGAPAKSVTIDMQDIKFVPNEFTIPANTPVKVTLKNTGALPHDFSIDKLNIHETLQPGKTGEVTINAPAGDYQYYCNQPGHKAAGMVGTMHVVAGGGAAAAPSGGSPAAASPGAASQAAASPAAASRAASPGAPSGGANLPSSLTVKLEDIKFVPKDFSIPANTPVKLTLQNTGALPHDFSVNQHKNPNVKNLNISVTLQPGKSQTITINAPAGDYYFYCNQPGHEAAGMFGTMHVVAAGGGGGQTGQAPAAPTKAAQKPASTAAAGGAAAGSSTNVTIDMQDIKFVPKDFSIPANTDVKVTLKNSGALPHNFSVNDHKNSKVKNLKISVTLQPGKSQTITINAPAGDYYFYCDQPGHEAAGMFGTMHVVAAGGGSQGGQAAAQPTQAAQQPASTAASGGATSVTMDMQDIKFVPNTFTIPANTDVKVTLKNTGALPHNFSIDKLNIHETLQPGKTTTFTIKAPAGTYQYYCNEPGHKAAGMVGTMTVK